MNVVRHRSRTTATGRGATVRDRFLARTVSGPLGRGASFCVELAAAVIRGLRGERQDPEERRY